MAGRHARMAIEPSEAKQGAKRIMRVTAAAWTLAVSLAASAGAARAESAFDKDVDRCAKFATLPAQEVIAACSRFINDPEIIYTWEKKTVAIFYRNRGFAYHGQRNFPAAMRDLDEAIRNDPRDALAYLFRGRTQADLGNDRAAVADYGRCLRLRPREFLCLHNRANSQARLRNYAAAIRDMTLAIQVDPKDAGAYAGRAWAYENAGNRQAAIRDYRMSIRLGSKDPRVPQRLAALDSGPGTAPPGAGSPQDKAICDKPPSPREGIAACTRVLQRASEQGIDRAVTLNQRAWQYYLLGMAAAGLRDANAALRLHPNFAAAYDTRGHLHRIAGNRNAAIADFNRALALARSESTSDSAREGLRKMGVAPPGPAHPHMIWRVRNRHSYAVELRFYSKTRNAVWPGAGKVWVLRDEDVHRYTLDCQPGEKICYGAWVSGRSSTYWGVGQSGNDGCGSCCFTCSNQVTPIMNLNP